MEQLKVCNSWEEFDDNSKLLEDQLEKLKLQKDRNPGVESEPKASSPSTIQEAPLKMRVLKRNPVPHPVTSVEVKPNEVAVGSTNGVTNNAVILEDSLRTQYVPPEPRISILSRPKKKSAEDLSSNNGKSKNQQVKTLEQREQEYAEARRRIFGDAVETEAVESSS